MAHPKVMEAAVIAIPDEKWMERPLAVVAPAPSAGQLDEAEIKGFLQDKIARFWMPDKIIFLQVIPKTSVGKFDKKVLRARYAEGELA